MEWQTTTKQAPSGPEARARVAGESGNAARAQASELIDAELKRPYVQGSRRYTLAFAELDAAYDAYRAQPDEAEAHALGDTIRAALRGQP